MPRSNDAAASYAALKYGVEGAATATGRALDSSVVSAVMTMMTVVAAIDAIAA